MSYPQHREVIRAQISKFLYNDESRPLADEDASGILGGQLRNHPLQMLADDELETLGFTLTAIRRVGWFKAWLDLQVHAIATNHLPGDCQPSPLQIAGSLTLAITEWEDQLNAAKRFAELRPDLVLPTPPAAPEPVATKTPAKPRGARKARRKAA